MKADARLFHCCRCHHQVIVCRSCDRGQIYCGSDCSRKARQSACHQAAQRYQNTQKGRLKHARRQQRYRARQQSIEEKVTHQGSTIPPVHDLLLLSATSLNKEMLAENASVLHCHFCQEKVSNYLRLDFIHRGIGKTATQDVFDAQGP